jgi:hypothetical protein
MFDIERSSGKPIVKLEGIRSRVSGLPVFVHLNGHIGKPVRLLRIHPSSDAKDLAAPASRNLSNSDFSGEARQRAAYVTTLLKG